MTHLIRRLEPSEEPYSTQPHNHNPYRMHTLMKKSNVDITEGPIKLGIERGDLALDRVVETNRTIPNFGRIESFDDGKRKVLLVKTLAITLEFKDWSTLLAKHFELV